MPTWAWIVVGVIAGLGFAFFLLVKIGNSIDSFERGPRASTAYKAEQPGEPWFPWYLQIAIAIGVVFQAVWRFITSPFRKRK